jgi:hypothetical protein
MADKKVACDCGKTISAKSDDRIGALCLETASAIR